jgi:hypothetical protein
MRLFTRLIVFVAAAMLLASGVLHVVDSWFGDKGSVVGAFRQIVHEARRKESLRSYGEIITRSREMKRDITAQLIAGRLSFRQAIAEFQRAIELVENVELDKIAARRSPTDPQRAGRQVFLWARAMVATLPSEKAKRLLSDFESEYKTLFGGVKPDEAAGV